MLSYGAAFDEAVPDTQQDRGRAVQRRIDWREYAVVDLQLDFMRRVELFCDSRSERLRQRLRV